MSLTPLGYRRFIVAILMFSVLGYGTAWAFEWHPVDVVDHAHAIEHADSGSAAGDGGCDHCCHAGAHLIGLAQWGQPISPFGCKLLVANWTEIFVTRSTDPPIKPPQS